MNKNNMTVAGSALAGSYVSPEAKVTEIYTEGVLCESPTGGHGNWNESDLWS